MNEMEIITFKGVRGYVDADGVAQLNLEDVARGLDITKTDRKNGAEYKRVHKQNLQRWLFSFGLIKSEYRDDCEIDRIDNNGDYCPENCHWVPVSENRKKTGRTHYITVDDVTKPVSEWCKLSHISKSKAYKVLKNGDVAFSEFCKGQQYFVNAFLGE